MTYFFSLGWKKKDANRGRQMIEASSSAGFPMAIAECHFNGWNGLEINDKAAFDLIAEFEKETNGYHWAQNLLGDCYFHGQGCDIDFHKAFDMFVKSVKQGNTLAMTDLAGMYEYGNGCTVDDLEAFRLFEQSAMLGNSKAMHKVSNKYKYGFGTNVNLKKSREWLAKGMAQDGLSGKKKRKKKKVQRRALAPLAIVPHQSN